MPATVYHPEYILGFGNQALWEIWTEADSTRMEEGGAKDNPAVGSIVYRKMEGLTRAQRDCVATHQTFRIVTALKRRNEDGDMYDLTRAFIEEARLHPFAPHDDLIDAVSRVFDMEPKSPIPFESLRADVRTYPDS